MCDAPGKLERDCYCCLCTCACIRDESASAKAGNYTAANVSPFHGSSKAFVQKGPETRLVLRSQTQSRNHISSLIIF